jgi:hypothetical protein
MNECLRGRWYHGNIAELMKGPFASTRSQLKTVRYDLSRTLFRSSPTFTEQVGLLSSRRSNFVSVYDPVFHDNGSLANCNSYGLGFGLTSRCPPTSIATYIPPTRLKSCAQGTLFCLTDAGAVYRQDLSIGPAKPTGEDEIWAHELQRLSSRVTLEHEEYGDLDLVEHTEASLRKDYNSEYIIRSAPAILSGSQFCMETGHSMSS